MMSTTTPAMEVVPQNVRVSPVPIRDLTAYQREMSKAVWRPAFGRKMAFVVTQDDHLLALLFLASPVIRLGPRDDHLFPNRPKDFSYGTALRNYMDLSVCVGAQPLAWYWNLGKMAALLAPTLGDYVEEKYGDELLGITTTSLWGRGSQYNRIYTYLGKTKGFGHQHVSDEDLASLKRRARADGFESAVERGEPVGSPAAGRGDVERKILPTSRNGDGSNPRMRMITFLWKVYPEAAPKEGLKHGQQRGIYYHPAVSASLRLSVVEGWYERWGLPRWQRKQNEQPPYQDGKS